MQPTLDLVNLEDALLELEPILPSVGDKVESTTVPRMRIMDLAMDSSIFLCNSGIWVFIWIILVDSNLLEESIDSVSNQLLVASPPMKKSTDIRLPSPYLPRERIDNKPLSDSDGFILRENNKTES